MYRNVYIPVILITSFIASFNVWPSEKTQFSTNMVRGTTIDGVEINRLTLRFLDKRSDIFWPYEGELETSKPKGVEATLNRCIGLGHKISGGGLSFITGKKISPEFYIESNSGLHGVKEDNVSNGLTPKLNLSAKYHPTKTIYYSFIFNHDYVYQHYVLPNRKYEWIREASGELLYKQYFFGRQLEFYSKARLSRYSDDYFSRKIQTVLNYSAEFEYIKLSAGLGGEYLSFTKERDGLWTPRHVQSIGASSGIMGQITTKTVGSFDYQQSLFGKDINSKEEASGNAYQFALRHGDRNSVLGTFVYKKSINKDKQTNEEWDMSEFSVQITLSH